MQIFYHFIWWFQDNFYIILILLYTGTAGSWSVAKKFVTKKVAMKKHVIKHAFLLAQFKKLSYLCTELKNK